MENDFAILALLLTVFIGATISEMFKHYLRYRQGFNHSATDQSIAELKAQNQVLFERVQTLEKIVTETDFGLKQEINQLKNG